MCLEGHFSFYLLLNKFGVRNHDGGKKSGAVITIIYGSVAAAAATPPSTGGASDFGEFESGSTSKRLLLVSPLLLSPNKLTRGSVNGSTPGASAWRYL